MTPKLHALLDRCFTDPEAMCQDNQTALGWLHLYHTLKGVLRMGLEGSVVELGCYKGGTAAWLSAILAEEGNGNLFHVYDSFAGLPACGEHDDKDAFFNEKPGLLAAEPQDVINSCLRLGVPQPIIHKGFFKDTIPQELPERIAFAHLDGDLYESIKTSLEGVLPRMEPGGAVVIDDYGFKLTPGVKKAVDEVVGPIPSLWAVNKGVWHKPIRCSVRDPITAVEWKQATAPPPGYAVQNRNPS